MTHLSSFLWLSITNSFVTHMTRISYEINAKYEENRWWRKTKLEHDTMETVEASPVTLESSSFVHVLTNEIFIYISGMFNSTRKLWENYQAGKVWERNGFNKTPRPPAPTVKAFNILTRSNWAYWSALIGVVYSHRHDVDKKLQCIVFRVDINRG